MMNATRSIATLCTILLIAGGCATHFRQSMERYEATETTPFLDKTLGWLESSESVSGATESIPLENNLPASEVTAATSDRLLNLTAEFFDMPVETLQPQLARYAESDPSQKIFDKTISWKELRLAVAALNPSVVAARERWQAALAQYSQAEYLEGLLAEYRTFTRYLKVETGKPLHKQMAQSFFPYPSTIALKGELISEQVRLAEMEWQKTLRDTIVEAGTAYYDYQYLVRAEATTRENVTLVENTLHVAEERYRSGTASQPDLLKVQTELERQRKMLQDLQVRQRSKAARIAALLGRVNHESFGPPADDAETDIRLAFPELIQLAHENRQEVRIQQAKVARAEVAIRLGEVMNRPLASQGYSQLERGMKPDASVGESGASYGLKAKANDRPAYAQAEAYLTEMRERLQSERAMLNGVLAETRGMAQAAWDELDIARRQVNLIDSIVLPQNQSTYETVVTNYQSGRASFLDLLDAERELIRARLELHDAHRNLNQALLRLISVSGKILKP